MPIGSESADIDSLSVLKGINPDGKVFKLMQRSLVVARSANKHDEIISGLTKLRDVMLSWVESETPTVKQITDEAVKVDSLLSKAAGIKADDNRVVSQLVTLRQQYSQLLEESQLSKGQIMDLTAEVATLTQLVDEQERTIELSKGQIMNLTAEVATLNQLIDEQKRLIDEQKRLIDEQERTIEELKSKLTPIQSYAMLRAAELRFIDAVCSVDESYDVYPFDLFDLKDDVENGEASEAVVDKWNEMNGSAICSPNLSRLFSRLSGVRTAVAHEEINEPEFFANLSEEDAKTLLTSNVNVKLPKKDLNAGLALHCATANNK